MIFNFAKAFFHAKYIRERFDQCITCIQGEIWFHDHVDYRVIRIVTSVIYHTIYENGHSRWSIVFVLFIWYIYLSFKKFAAIGANFFCKRGRQKKTRIIFMVLNSLRTIFMTRIFILQHFHDSYLYTKPFGWFVPRKSPERFWYMRHLFAMICKACESLASTQSHHCSK